MKLRKCPRPVPRAFRVCKQSTRAQAAAAPASAHTPPAGLSLKFNQPGPGQPPLAGRRKSWARSRSLLSGAVMLPACPPHGTFTSPSSHVTIGLTGWGGSSHVRGPEAPPQRAHTWAVGENQIKLSACLEALLFSLNSPGLARWAGPRLSVQIKAGAPDRCVFPWECLQVWGMWIWWVCSYAAFFPGA